MPEFRNREEYERWKAERLKESQDRQRSRDQQASDKRPAAPDQQSPSSRSPELTDIGDLLNQSWGQFKERIGVLLPLHLLSLVFLIAGILLAVGIGALIAMMVPQCKTPVLLISALIGLTIGLTAMFWPVSALVVAVADPSLGMGDALAQGWKKLWAFLWLFSILGYVVAGGYLLFIVPGVIFTIWFIFSQFILAEDNARGMDAMLKSKEYVKGRWFDVFLRFLVLWALSTGLGMIPLLGIILSIMLTPFMMIYSYLIFTDLKRLRPEVAEFKPDPGEKIKWVGAATLGYIVLPLIIIAIVGTVCMIPLLMMNGMNFHQVPPPQRFF
ncbi:MAG: hypothetical protein HZB62_05385 [Nitrospirae bacterium]|nr:hypothetical protein [Nitrospirota bacterium]